VSPADSVLPLPECLTWGIPAGWLALRAHNVRIPSPLEALPGPADPRPRPANGPDGDVNSPLERAARLLQTGRRDEAEHLLSDLLNQDPGDVVAWFLLGEALLRRGEQVQAQLAFRRASGLKASAVEGIDLNDDSAVADARLTLRQRSNRTT
jgi:tetratricopeptide (TPR) repeat protein